MTGCGEKLTEQKLCEKILRSLHPMFDYIVCAIEESKDISTLSLEELQRALEAIELRLDKRNDVKYGDQALTTQRKHKKNDKDEAFAAQEDDSKSYTILLMATTNEEPSQSQLWFLDTGCFNHMTSHNEWLVDIDTSRRSKIRFIDDRILEAEGVGNMEIENVLYVSEMKNNLLSICQLIHKGLQVIMKNDALETYDGQKKIILKVPLSDNRTIVVNIQVADIQC
uniref:Uncharacterized protein LOC101506660 n=1 Tax=Cicer arietinum TaxID=3827 RepID=A0A1S2XDG7_CICAR|nr:uncharacterized protein LOC101506660 [Cicer arietinum]